MAEFENVPCVWSNRRFQNLLQTQLREARRTGERVALLIVDLKSYEFLYRRHSMQSIRFMMTDIIARVRASVRSTDLVARTDFDQLTLLLHALRKDANVRAIAKRVCSAAISSPFAAGGEQCIVPEIGIAAFRDDAPHPEDSTREETIESYVVEEDVNGSYRIRPHVAEPPVAQLPLLTATPVPDRSTFAADAHHAGIYYRIMTDISMQRLVAFEAFVGQPDAGFDRTAAAARSTGAARWGSPGVCSEQQIRTICEQGRRWNALGRPPVRMCVKLRRTQLSQEGFPAMVETILRDTGLTPSLLEVTIAERDFADCSGSFLRILYHLKQIGVSLAVDELGTEGFSPAYMGCVPVDRLRMDCTLLLDRCDAEIGLETTRLFVSLARHLRLDVVADGVETERQVERLLAIGITTIAGGLLGNPQEPAAFSALFAQASLGEFILGKDTSEEAPLGRFSGRMQREG